MTSEASFAELFEFKKILGEGWSAQTWLACLRIPRYGLPIGAPLAVKRYKKEIFSAEPRISERIRREGHIGERIIHPNVVRIFELFEGDPNTGHGWALSMELCGGGNLTEYLKTFWPLPATKLLTISSRLADGLNELHSGGFIHRDIKPDNILITDQGVPKIADFGVIHHVEEVTITGSADFLGTIRYSAPEVLVGGGAEAASDIYSFGALIYQCLYGVRPYDAEELFSKIIMEIAAGPPKLLSHNDRLGPQPEISTVAIESIVEAMLHSKPSNRPRIEQVVAWMRNPAEAEPFRLSLEKIVLEVTEEEHYKWSALAKKEATLFPKFACWRVVSHLNPDDAVNLVLSRDAGLIHGNPTYLDALLEHAPQGEQYRSLPHTVRKKLVTEALEVFPGYVKAVWDDIEVQARRKSAFLGFLKQMFNYEVDEEIRSMLKGAIDNPVQTRGEIFDSADDPFA